MNESWKTLLQLTNFMKYLLKEVLPHEEIENPHEILDSLFLLLNTTLECCQVIRDNNAVANYSPKHKIKDQLKNIKLHSSANNISVENTVKKEISAPGNDIKQNTISKNKNKKNKTDNGNDNIKQDTASNNDSQPASSQSSISKNSTDNGSILNDNNKQDTASRTDSQPASSESKIPKNKKKGTDNGSILNDNIKQNTASRNDSQPASSQSVLSDKEKLMLIASGTGSFTRHHSIIISNNFLFLDEQIFSGSESVGCFCIPCDKCFFREEHWLDHTNDYYHSAKVAKLTCEEVRCEMCDFLVFGNFAIADTYIDFHMKAHTQNSSHAQNSGIRSDYVQDGKNDASANRSSEKKHATNFSSSNSSLNTAGTSNITELGGNISSSNSSLNKVGTRKKMRKSSSVSSSNSSLNKVGTSKKAAKREVFKYVISDLFNTFNQSIHEHNLRGQYYCRPCEIHVAEEKSWKQHCKSGKHMSLMSSPNFCNYEAKCHSCDLLFLGTDRAVKEYMKLHIAGHGGADYSMSPISKPSEHVELHTNQPDSVETKKKRVRKNTNSEIENVETEVTSISNDPPPNLPVAPVTNDSNTTVNNSSQGSQDGVDVNKLKEMCLARKKDKLGGRPIVFGGYCVPCEILTEDAFDWIDHLGSSDHSSRVKSSDEEITFPSYNLSVFGNKDNIKGFIP